MSRTLKVLLIVVSMMLTVGFVSGQEMTLDPTSQVTNTTEGDANSFLQPPSSIDTATAVPQPFAPAQIPVENRAEFDRKMAEAAKNAADQRSNQPAVAPVPVAAPIPSPRPPVMPKPKSVQAPDETLYTEEKSLPKASSSRKKPVEDYDYVVVLPEVAQAVELSNTDNNRLICGGVIQDVVYSAEKGVIVKYTGQNAFIKFKILKKSNGELVYAKNPTELFVVCNGETYNIIGLPKKIQAQTVRLSSGKKQVIKKNQSLMAGLPMERKVMALINYVHKDAIPESFEIVPVNKRVKLYKGLGITFNRTINLEGEGLLLKEYTVKNEGIGQAVLNEGYFLKPEITKNTLAIAIGDGKMNLNKGESTRLYVVELTDGGTDFGKR